MHSIPLASKLQIVHERLLHQLSSLAQLELGKSKETTVQLLPCSYALQQFLLAKYQTGGPKVEQGKCYFY